MATAKNFFVRLKELTLGLRPRHDAFRYLYLVRTENRGKRSARLAGSGWQGLAPQARSLRREFVALFKATP